MTRPVVIAVVLVRLTVIADVRVRFIVFLVRFTVIADVRVRLVVVRVRLTIVIAVVHVRLTVRVRCRRRLHLILLVDQKKALLHCWEQCWESTPVLND